MANENVPNSVVDKTPVPSAPNVRPLEPAAVHSQGSNDVWTTFMCLPYIGQQGEEIVRKFKDVLLKSIPTYVQPRIIYTGKKIESFFRVKDKIPKEHKSNLVYAFKTDEVRDYVGETKVRYGTRTREHIEKD